MNPCPGRIPAGMRRILWSDFMYWLGLPQFKIPWLYLLHRLGVFGLTLALVGVVYYGCPIWIVCVPLAVDTVACAWTAGMHRLPWRSPLRLKAKDCEYRYGVLWTPVLRVFLIAAVCCGLGVLCAVVLDGPAVIPHPDATRLALLAAGFRELVTGWADLRIRQGF